MPASSFLTLPTGQIVELTGAQVYQEAQNVIIILENLTKIVLPYPNAVSATNALNTINANVGANGFPGVATIQWSPDDMTWANLPAPAGVQSYFKITGVGLPNTNNGLMEIGQGPQQDLATLVSDVADTTTLNKYTWSSANTLPAGVYDLYLIDVSLPGAPVTIMVPGGITFA